MLMLEFVVLVGVFVYDMIVYVFLIICVNVLNVGNVDWLV